MTLGRYLIRRVGSQGQNKTYLIALKLAQFAFLNKRGQTTPILLLDDIFDKLDASRVEQIIKLVSENGFGQIFITDTNRKYLDEILLAMNHEDNTELYEKMMEIRVQRAWGEVLGPTIMQYTRNIYVRDKVLHVSLTSSVLRSELTLCRERLGKSLNDYAGASVITNIVFH